MRFRGLLVIAILLIAAAGCSQLLDLRNPEYYLRSVDARPRIAVPISASSIDFAIDIEIDNPNSIALTLDEIEFDLFVNGNRLVRQASAENIRIPARGTGLATLGLRVDYDDIRGLFREVADIILGERPEYRIEGTARYGTPIGPIEFPFSVTR